MLFSINFLLIFWIEYGDEPRFLTARSEAIMAITKAYRKHGITIPFPIRTIDFKNRLEVTRQGNNID